MNILLYEHVSSGGYAGEPIPGTLLCEGYSMLRALTEDFNEAGNEVTVLLDQRIAAFHPPLKTRQIVQIAASGEADPSMEKVAENADAVYVIAPEANHVLQSIVECIESTGTLSLNSEATGIEQAANKANLENHAKRLNLHFPKTETFKTSDSSQEIAKKVNSELSFPAVVKPTFGAGCGGLSVVKNENDVLEAIAKITRETAGDQVTAQELVMGVPVSVSLLCTETRVFPVTLNLQDVKLAAPEGVSSYEGGMVPFEHELRDEVFSAAKKLVLSFAGLRGYVGVDFILSDGRAFIMEINPRLTTSYVGVRKVANFNLATAILNAVIKNELPEKTETNGFSRFKKFAVNDPSSSALQQIFCLNSVMAPPFPLAKGGYFAFIQSNGKTSKEASLHLQEDKKHFQHIIMEEGEQW